VVSEFEHLYLDAEKLPQFFSYRQEDPKIILNGPDPGIKRDETEAVIDVEWSGAVAKNGEHRLGGFIKTPRPPGELTSLHCTS